MVNHSTTQHAVRTASASATGRVALIAKPGDSSTGVGRYVQMLHNGLRHAGIDAVRVAPSVPPLPHSSYALLRRLGVDAHTFLLNYPVWASYPPADVYHITSQNLASLLLFRRPPGRVVVTVHDIIPYMLRNNRQLCPYRTVADRLFDRLAMAGLRRADQLIAVSRYTKQCATEQLQIESKRITVIYEGIEHEHFKPMAVPNTIRQRYGLLDRRRYLIYVGSEDPRKNLTTLLHALAEVRRALPDVELIKVGRAHFVTERERLLALAVELGIREAVHFLDDVPEDDLPLLYNLADVCVLPSLYEGFGFPVLEAMACGTPVVVANATSLPELVGDAGLLFTPGPDAVPQLANALETLLLDKACYATLRAKGLTQAARFSWRGAIRSTRDVLMSLSA